MRSLISTFRRLLNCRALLSEPTSTGNRHSRYSRPWLLGMWYLPLITTGLEPRKPASLLEKMTLGGLFDYNSAVPFDLHFGMYLGFLQNLVHLRSDSMLFRAEFPMNEKAFRYCGARHSRCQPLFECDELKEQDRIAASVRVFAEGLVCHHSLGLGCPFSAFSDASCPA